MHETGATAAPRRSRSAGRATLPAASEFRRRVRDALAHLNDPVYLRSHQLAGVSYAASSPAAQVSSSALRQAVVDAIQSLQPDARVPADSAAWRRYRILQLRYEEGGNARSVQSTLAISKGEYYRSHRDAVQAVVDVLWERFAAGSGVAVSAPREFFRLRPRFPLPVPLTNIIGRESELAAAQDALAGGRLVTLTGPPGTGKTRLALELARTLAREYADGVFFVDLAPIADPEQFIPAIARVIEIDAEAGPSDERRSIHERLVAELQSARALLVLDNFEQVVDAGPALADLLWHCPNVTALVTSRVPLRVRGEAEMLVPPLGLPAAIHAIDAAQAGESPAVQLFLERARGVRAGFDLTDQNGPAVAELCVRLDGLPLALELAAARADVLSPEGILARLDARSLALDPGPRDLPPRQQTLNAAIGWSYDLLDEQEQALFRRLAVFSGGWSVDSADAVVGGHNLVDGLSALLRSSLVQRRTAPSPPPSPARGVGPGAADGTDGRFTLLETIRAFGLEQLAAAEEREVLHRRHAEYFSSLVASSEWARTRPLVRALDGGTDSNWQAREGLVRQAEAEEDNLRAALDWAVDRGDAEKALWLAAGLAALGFYRGYPASERPQLKAALELPGGQGATPARAAALNVLGALADLQGDAGAGRALFEEELEIEECLGDQRSIGHALIALRRIAVRQMRFPEGRALNERALRIFRQVDDPVGLAAALNGVGLFALFDGDLARARGGFEEALSVTGFAPALALLGIVALEEGKLEEARQHFEGFFEFSHPPYNDDLVCNALEGLARLAIVDGRVDRRFRLAGAAAVLRVTMKLPPVPWQNPIEQALAWVRVAPDDPRLEAAWTEGQAMTIEDAIRYALTRD